MRPIEEIELEIGVLETLYADAFGDNASATDLDAIWQKIKALRKEAVMKETFQSGTELKFLEEDQTNNFCGDELIE